MKSTTTVTTPHASRYLQQLCKHFDHKIEVSYDAERGHCDFGQSQADLLARRDALDITISASTRENLEKGRVVVWNHLERFAFREGLDDPVWAEAEGA